MGKTQRQVTTEESAKMLYCVVFGAIIDNFCLLPSACPDLLNAIQLLEEQDRLILIQRFGIADGTPKTLAVVGAMFGISGNRVRQREQRALRRLRRMLVPREISVSDTGDLRKQDLYWIQDVRCRNLLLRHLAREKIAKRQGFSLDEILAVEYLGLPSAMKIIQWQKEAGLDQ